MSFILLGDSFIFNLLLYYVALLFSLIAFRISYTVISPKKSLKEYYFKVLYLKSLKIFDNDRLDIKYEIIEAFSITNSNYKDAQKEFKFKAFELKTDAIINYKHTLVDVVKGKKEKVFHKFEGIAIRLLITE